MAVRHYSTVFFSDLATLETFVFRFIATWVVKVIFDSFVTIWSLLPLVKVKQQKKNTQFPLNVTFSMYSFEFYIYISLISFHWWFLFRFHYFFCCCSKPFGIHNRSICDKTLTKLPKAGLRPRGKNVTQKASD